MEKTSFQTGITPDDFYRLFMLCLWWQWNPEDMRSMYTTVDKVLSVLVERDIINQTQRDEIQDSMTMERRFLRSMLIRSTGEFAGNASQRRDGILCSPRQLVAYGPQYSLPGGVDHLMFDARIYLTWRGVEYAVKHEERYAHIITRRQYLWSNWRRKQYFESLTPVGRATIMARYHHRIKSKVAAHRTEEFMALRQQFANKRR